MKNPDFHTMRSYAPSSTFAVPPAVMKNAELFPKSKLILLDAMSRSDSWVTLNPDGTRSTPFDNLKELRQRAGLTDRKTWQKHREQLERFGLLKLTQGYSKGRHWKAYIWSWSAFWSSDDVFSLVDLADDPADWDCWDRNDAGKTYPAGEVTFEVDDELKPYLGGSSSNVIPFPSSRGYVRRFGDRVGRSLFGEIIIMPNGVEFSPYNEGFASHGFSKPFCEMLKDWGSSAADLEAEQRRESEADLGF